jgi:hypothetical protein
MSSVGSAYDVPSPSQPNDPTDGRPRSLGRRPCEAPAVTVEVAPHGPELISAGISWSDVITATDARDRIRDVP